MRVFNCIDGLVPGAGRVPEPDLARQGVRARADRPRRQQVWSWRGAPGRHGRGTRVCTTVERVLHRDEVSSSTLLFVVLSFWVQDGRNPSNPLYGPISRTPCNSAKTGFNINEAMLELVREIVRTRERERFQDLVDHSQYGEEPVYPVQAKTKGYQKSPTPPGPYPMEEEEMEMEKGCCCTIM